MSVLNQSGEEQVECPLCMEPLEVDDLNFFPCTCGYQICRFCWHRIRTDENGLCPACRKAYPEDPADFKPLSQEEVSRLKAEKRQRDLQRKQKLTENRKHLANVRVVQRNLVFVVGLPVRLADPEVLKKHEYFGKFGKILKVVINQSTTYAGSQGPSASAYVTYQRSEDALRAIQAVNNIAVDGRTVKTSLGTTKYCSHFLKNQACPKPDCMYLHELDSEASFTKEEMQQGKHQEYEKKLHDQLIINCQNRKPTPSPPTVEMGASQQSTPKEAWPSLNNQHNAVIVGVAEGAPPPAVPSNNNKGETQGQTSVGNHVKEKKQSHNKHKHRNNSGSHDSNCDQISNHRRGKEDGSRIKDETGGGRDSPSNTNTGASTNTLSHSGTTERAGTITSGHPINSRSTNNISPGPILQHNNSANSISHNNTHLLRPHPTHPHQQIHQTDANSKHRASAIFEQDNHSFFSSNNFTKVNGYSSPNGVSGVSGSSPRNGSDWTGASSWTMPEVLEVHSSADWQAAFGFSRPGAGLGTDATGLLDGPDHRPPHPDDADLGFDPFHETQKALAEMIEKEEQHMYQPKLILNHNNRLNSCSKLLENLRIGSVGLASRPPPPGFTSAPTHMNAFGLGIPRTAGSKILGWMQHGGGTGVPTGLLHHTGNSVGHHTHTHSHTQNIAQSHTQIPNTLPWDWSTLDPAIVTSAQHCDLYSTSQPPPGFTLRQTLTDNM